MKTSFRWVAICFAFLALPAKADILESIEQGKQILSPLAASKNIAHLAVLNPDGLVEAVSIRVDPKSNGPGSVESHSPVGYIFEWDRLNGVNTNFRVVQPAGAIVVAIKRKLKHLPGSAIYVPYSEGLNVPELRSAGLRYMEETILAAERQIRERGVASKIEAGEFAASKIPLELALTLALIEHIDPDRSQNEPMEKLLDEVLVIIGANKGDAYRYAVSPKAKARGLFQFISKTYNEIRKRYPAAKLKRDFVSGMDDHLNGAISSFLLFDNDLKFLFEARPDFSKDPPELGRYLAAAYNGGPSRVVSAIDESGQLLPHLLKPETRIYIKKYEKVWFLVSEEAVAFRNRVENRNMLFPAAIR